MIAIMPRLSRSNEWVPLLAMFFLRSLMYSVPLFYPKPCMSFSQALSGLHIVYSYSNNLMMKLQVHRTFFSVFIQTLL
jgi:hypothetical protein